MPVSIKDIAREAGVSPSTVSRALHDHPRISPETKAYIQGLAREMGYVPSAVARNLVARRSATIGVVLPNLADPHYARLLLGIEDAAASHGYQVVLSSFYRDPDRELAIVQDFQERRMDGIIVAGTFQNQTCFNEESFFTPVVLIDRPTYPYSVSIDGFSGAKKVVEHLIELGHRQIAYITGGSENHDDLNRLNGYRTTLSEHAIPVDDSLVMAGDGAITGGINAMKQMLALPEPPTAIFGFNDMTIIGALNTLRQRGYEVPRDFSMAGYDDLELARYFHPPLTTVRQPTYRAGQGAVDMLVKLISGAANVSPESLDPELVVRQSTAPLSN